MDGGELYTVGGWPSWGWCATLSLRQWVTLPMMMMMGSFPDDQILNGWWPSWRWWLNILGMVVDHIWKMVDHLLGGWWPYSIWWVIFLRRDCDHPGDGRWPSIAVLTLCQFCELCLSAKFQVFSTLSFAFSWCVAILVMIGDTPWQLLPGLSFVSSVSVPNTESVVYFLLLGDHPWAGG